MEELKKIVRQAQAGEAEAYSILVQQFQDMAVGYGYSILGDFSLAQDAAQEAFISAYYHLSQLREAAAFPSWFRRIIFKHCDRLVRGKQLAMVALDDVMNVVAAEFDVAEAFEQNQAQAKVHQAIGTLPQSEREVVTLFYISQYSHKEISAFLELPVTTIKSRLHSARKRLKERMIAVIQENLPKQRPSKDEKLTEKVMSLFKVIAEGDVSTVKALLAADATLVGSIGLEWSPYWHGEASALHVAVMHGRKDIVDLLLAQGADINGKEKHGWTAINFAIDMAYCPQAVPNYHFQEMFDFLVSRGAKKDIFVYLWLNDYEGVKTCLEANPTSANVLGPNNATPLCYVGDEKTAQLLLDYGADMHFKLEDEWCRERGIDTPLRWAASRPENPNFLRFLLKWAGIEVDIFLACTLGDTEKVAAILKEDPSLIRARTDENHVLQPNFTPLHVAARYRRPEVAKLLLEHGADVNATTSSVKNMTPLHLAVWLSSGDENYVRLEVPRLLLEHGAEVNARDSERDLTPLGWAEARDEDEEKDRSEVAALLREFGAEI